MTNRATQPWFNYLLGVVCAGAIVAAILVVGPASGSETTVTRTAKAAQGVVQSTVSGSGNLAAASQLNLGFKTSGTVTNIYVTQGQHVTAGQLLATLDPQSAEVTLEQSKAALQSAEANLAKEEETNGETSTGAGAATASGSGSSSTGGASASAAAITPASSAGDLPGAGAGTSANVAYTDAATFNADAADTPAYATSGAQPTTPGATTVPDTTAPGTTIAAAPSATTPSATAPAATTPTSTSTTPSTTPASKAPSKRTATNTAPTSTSSKGSTSGGASETTKEAKTRSSTSATVSTATREANLASARAAVKSDRLTVQSDEQAVQDTKLYAPEDGTIVSLTGQVGEVVSGSGTTKASSSSSSSGSGSSTGANAAGGASALGGATGSSSSSKSSSSSSSSSSSAFAVLSDLSSMQLVVPLSESEIGNVKAGQPATVTVEALSGVKLAAHVSEVALLSTSSSGAVSYDVTFQLDQMESGLKVGMSATAEVVVKQAEGVNVPTSAISADSVIVERDGKQVRQRVTTGLAGNTSTIVLSGLQAGETVVLPAASTTSSSGGLTSKLGGRTGAGLGGAIGGGGFAGGGGPAFFRGGG
jgi:multidrug efflux pump subunit AcrA (membrane-fusion protein)